jgi:hypothetical protein
MDRITAQEAEAAAVLLQVRIEQLQMRILTLFTCTMHHSGVPCQPTQVERSWQPDEYKKG